MGDRTRVLLVSLVSVVCGCQPAMRWDMSIPVCISVAWNLPTPDAYVDGLSAAVRSLGGSVVPGNGPSASMFCPVDSQPIHIADGNAGAGLCDPDGHTLGWTSASDNRITVCHNPAVFNAAFNPPDKVALGARITMFHEMAHKGGLPWHWDCADLREARIMGSERRCEVTADATYTAADLGYVCAGGNIVSHVCDSALPLPDDAVRRLYSDGSVVRD